MLNKNISLQYANQFWDEQVIPALSDFIRIPAKSIAFDDQWEEHGYLEQAAQLFVKWAQAQNIKGLTAEIVKEKNRTPIVFVEIEGNAAQTTLFYGHLDKMPESEGWDKNKGPWQPVLENDRLYGRGSVDNGYGFFTFLAAIKLLQAHNISHPRCVILIESCEETDSRDLPYYLESLKSKIGEPNLVACLDVGAYDYERLWCTNSLRGLIEGTLSISVLQEAVHSGTGGGIVPCTFRILRQLLDRIENKDTGEILIKSANVALPSQAQENIKNLAKFLGKNVYANIPLLDQVQPLTNNFEDLLTNMSWRPALSVLGAEGLPAFNNVSCVIRTTTAVYLSLRLPPLCNPEQAAQECKKILEQNPPYNAKVNFDIKAAIAGWSAQDMQGWLKEAINSASCDYFGNTSLFSAEGGSVGVIAELGNRFPKAQFFMSGLLTAPGANEHGPNESLYLPAAKKMTCAVAHILAKQAQQQ